MDDIEFTLTDLDFQLEHLDFSNLEPAEFENLIFHLLDEMGFSNLLWRKGGEGNSATDSGRDLEATYWQVGPVDSAELSFWYEVKYRSGQLKKSQVQEAILAASAKRTLDQLVIVTNSTVSNPCLDWVEDFRQAHAHPLITIWQGHDLEILLRKNPRTLARFIPSALSFSGRCKIIESRFSNLFLLPSVDELTDVWNRLEIIGDRALLLLACVLSESAYGNLVDRPWGMRLDRETLTGVVATAIANTLPFVHRIAALDRSQTPLFKGIAYLVACMLVRGPHEIATEVVYDPERFFEIETRPPPEVNTIRIRPILATLNDQLAVHCSAKYCTKLHYREPADDMPEFFARFRRNPPREARDNGFLIMQSQKAECKLGIVPKDAYCPLAESVPDHHLTRKKLSQHLAFAKSVLDHRVAELESDSTHGRSS